MNIINICGIYIKTFVLTYVMPIYRLCIALQDFQEDLYHIANACDNTVYTYRNLISTILTIVSPTFDVLCTMRT